MGRYLVITCRENVAVDENKAKVAITHDGGLKYYESKPAAVKAIMRQSLEWERTADPDPQRVFAGIWDTKKRVWL